MPARAQRVLNKSQQPLSKSEQTSSKSQQPSSSKAAEEDRGFAIVRDENSDMLRVLPRNKLIPIKKSAKIAIGDTVSYGLRTESVRGVVILIGSEEECKQSFDIIQRTKSSSSSSETDVKSSVESINHSSPDEEIDCDGMNEDIADDTDGFDSEDPGIKHKEGSYLSDEETDKENNPTNINISPSPILTSTDCNAVPHLNTESVISYKRKTPPINVSSSVSPMNKRQKSLGFASMREHASLVSQLAQVNEENMVLHTTSMPRPVDKQTIDYFIHVGKTLSNYVNEISDGGGGDNLDRGEILAFISETLDMTEAELRAYTGKNLLSTAREVIGAKYPDSLTTFADVQKEHIQAVADKQFSTKYKLNKFSLSPLDYACLIHPLEKRSNDMSKIRKAMGNVFATRKFSQKLKAGSVSMNNTTTSLDTDASI